MYTFKVFLLVFIVQFSEASASSESGVFKEEYLHPKTMDHEKLSGRWYGHMDTLNNTMRDNTVMDSEVVCEGRLRGVLIIHRWIPSLEECRTSALGLETETPDSPEGTLIRMSTNETLGKIAHKYIDPHPTDGFLVGCRLRGDVCDHYFISTRQKNPSNLDEVIKQVAAALNIQDFNLKSKDFGCERKEENGIKL